MMQRSRRRWLAAVGAIASLGLAAVALKFSPGRNEGTWMCLACGRQREEVRHWGVTVWTGPAQEVTAEASAGFEDWFTGNVGTSHRHHWDTVGCHRIGMAATACSMGRGESYFAQLPQLEDQALAVQCARRLLAARPQERRARLSELDALAWELTGRRSREYELTPELLHRWLE